MKQTDYYISRWNEREKFIKNTPEHCEIIILVDGKLTHKTFPSPYPAGDEDLVPISAQQWNKKLLEVQQ